MMSGCAAMSTSPLRAMSANVRKIIFITRVALLRADLPVVLCEVEPPRTKEMDASDDVVERIRRDGGLHEGPLGGEPIQLHAEQHLGRARQGAELHDFAGVTHEILAQVFPVFHRIGIGLGAGGMLGKPYTARPRSLAAAYISPTDALPWDALV